MGKRLRVSRWAASVLERIAAAVLFGLGSWYVAGVQSWTAHRTAVIAAGVLAAVAVYFLWRATRLAFQGRKKSVYVTTEGRAKARNIAAFYWVAAMVGGGLTGFSLNPTFVVCAVMGTISLLVAIPWHHLKR